ncbi:hypothetical protein I302_108472 [Kwoniella bestiolae CBS 10118]|uniref:Uncharacterized protein n=1 Tax=Kwoniella bestiolae CBS 10118 TaxID=1296100 RepID=A0A1B9FVN8_9TREE|nr:hypothetical protein I302_07152 [Kwoniella bestiolae CBS 10118]OCF22811.1 hypothetical protein I302_07152 [Kwoniella bestiolae CBS 10118]
MSNTSNNAARTETALTPGVLRALGSVTIHNSNITDILLASAYAQYYTQKRRLDAIENKGHLHICSLDEVRSTVESWVNADGVVMDQVLGLGNLMEKSRKAGWDNDLMRPVVVQKNRVYVDAETNRTYLFHHKNILPAIGIISTLSPAGCLASTILSMEALRLTQTRYDDVFATNPTEEGKAIQAAMKRIQDEINEIYEIECDIPHNISELAKVDPKELKAPLDKLTERLDSLIYSNQAGSS